ncbi:cytochrome P450 [Streptomyces sp. NPDC006984]|uniref:cytochrome P450 n=1 Tax=Streptomyces sp. NPDC006984 TaxID=3155463 RepID=UPI00340A4E3A
MTPQSPFPNGAVPPPGCPAHDAGLHRLPEVAHPASLYEQLRQQYGPVAPVLLYGDVRAWIVLGYRENLEVMRTPSLFSRDSRRWSAFRDGLIPDDSPLLPMVGWQPICVFADGEEHARLRSAVVDGLAQVNRRGMRRLVTQCTRQLVESPAFAGGSADLVRDYAEPLPMLVVSRLIGMEPHEGPALVEPTLDLMRGSETAAASNATVTRVLEDLVRRKKEHPGSSDLASHLISHPSGLSDTEIVEHLRLVLVAAHQGTVNLIAQTLRLTLTDRRFRGSLSGGQMTLPDALEQVMWDNPSISVIPGRWATGNTMLGNQQIREGDLLLLCIAAANVDPEIRPDLSIPLHGNRSHLSLSSGPHECPGGDVGRSIADTGIDELMMLLPDMELTIPPTAIGITADWLTQRPASLPVRFTPPRATSHQAPAPAQFAASQPLPAAEETPPARPAATTSDAGPWWRRPLTRNS